MSGAEDIRSTVRNGTVQQGMDVPKVDHKYRWEMIDQFFNSDHTPQKIPIGKVMSVSNGGLCYDQNNSLLARKQQSSSAQRDSRPTHADWGSGGWYGAAGRYRGAEQDEEEEETTCHDFSQLSVKPSCETGMTALEIDDCHAVYKYYDFTKHRGTHLPINSCKDEIIKELQNSNTLIIRGFTGCGKSTQAPQFVLDYCYERKEPCNIIVAQPRRIAAKTLAQRVCEERNWKLGTLVGYQVGMDQKVSASTRLTYCTTGVLLEKIITKKRINMFSHIVLDEVHERDQDMDIVMLLIRMYHTESPAVKVILMSATFDVQKFARYMTPFANVRVPPPVIEVAEKMLYANPICYLNHLDYQHLGHLGSLPELKMDEPKLYKEFVKIAVNFLKKLDVRSSLQNAILIFLPGLAEIEKMMRTLEEAKESENRKWWILPLHSSVTDEEQNEVLHSKPGHLKIILATNIAESSITVPDVGIVVDFCLTKILKTRPEDNLSYLSLEWAAKTNCMQRAGRAGRVKDGCVYRMVSKEFYDDFMQDEPTPEILRSPLEGTILHLKMLQMKESPAHLLEFALDPPGPQSVMTSILVLKEVGALTLTYKGKPDLHNGDLTYLGVAMGSLPLDMHISKLIVFGYLFGVLEEAIIIGAALSLRSPFKAPFKKNKLLAYQGKVSCAKRSKSDCLAMLSAYRQWKMYVSDTQRDYGREKAKKHCKSHFLQEKVLKEQDAFIAEIKTRLKNVGLYDMYPSPKWKENERKFHALKTAIAGAFYPNYFVRESGGVDENSAVKDLAGGDPKLTVSMKASVPVEHLSSMAHVRGVVDTFFEGCPPIKDVFFDSSRMFVEFSQNAQDNMFSSEISAGVYYALKMKHTGNRLRVPETPRVNGTNHVIARRMGYGDGQNYGSSCPLQIDLPPTYENQIAVVVVHVNDPRQFWVQYWACQDAFKHMLTLVSEHLRTLKPLQELPIVGGLYLARYRGLPDLYRVQVMAVTGPEISVRYLDFGNTAVLKRRSELFAIPKLNPMMDTKQDKWWENGRLPRDLDALVLALRMMPALAVECCLSEISRDWVRSSKHDSWHPYACEYVMRAENEPLCYANIYSTVSSVMAIELLIPKKKLCQPDISLAESDLWNVGEELIKKGYAVRTEEWLLSKKNHADRMKWAQNATIGNMSLFFPGKASIPKPTPNKMGMKMGEMDGEEVIFSGPDSPLEMRMFSPLRSNEGKRVEVEHDSVNSILLEEEPHDPHIRLMVACSVDGNSHGSLMLAKNTTLLPSIPGLPAIMSMLFSPAMELQVDSQGTGYAGALCGLGHVVGSCEPLFPEHDNKVRFDVHFDQDDIKTINSIKETLHNTIKVDRSNNGLRLVVNKTALADCHRHVNDELFKLLQRKREPRNVESSYSFGWTLLSADEKLRKITPFGQQLHLNNAELVNKALHKLRTLAAENQDHVATICCPLCGNKRLETKMSILLHLQTKKHIKREEEFVGHDIEKTSTTVDLDVFY